ncbi:polysaccharide biosynthesis/export family protein [Sphingomonas baiyangensis]|uniref:Polysaccharide export protein n=1 Tax=Sphingomonas baiyangensis TaxID=2572576 RepID=A0A4U1L0P2_9SPHN|nr:polysaccharide biosynthesis/export family protein [Sphingomonas baiyangensis]TKD50311.1 polysaccharide export protein [Sphingomonas baiyangensis]
MMVPAMLRGSRQLMAIAFAFGMALLLAGCSTGSRGGPVAYDRTDFVAPDLPAIQRTADHRLMPGDVVTINVFQVEALSGEHTVDSTGNIQLPLIGAIEAQGRTTSELAQTLTTQLDARYLRQPRVQVALKEAEAGRITVDGSVTQPGIFEIRGPTTLIQAVAMARGTDQNANPKRVVVFRTINGQRQAAAFDLTTIRTGVDPDPAIYSNDIIVVDGSRSRQAFRDFIQSVPLLAIFRPF